MRVPRQVFSNNTLAAATDLRKKGAVEDEGSDREKLLILYGTQTGTAEKFSRELAAEARDRYQGRVNVVVQDLDEYDGPTKLASVSN